MNGEAFLFDLPPDTIRRVPDEVERLSPDRRRTLRQATDLKAGRHPLGGRVHKDAAPHDGRQAPGLRCGSCRFRWLFEGPSYGLHGGTFPKCTLGAPEGEPALGARVTNGAATDCRAWWPACTKYQPKQERETGT